MGGDHAQDALGYFGGIPIYTSRYLPDDTAIVMGDTVLGKITKLKVTSGNSIRGREISQVWFDDYAETEDGVGYLRSEALKKFRAEDAQRELEAVPGFGSF
jgi:hypothetical protein